MMKRKNAQSMCEPIFFLFCIWPLLFSTLAHAGAAALFTQAKELYARGAYKEAVEVYEGIDDPGSSVWYNMGNCLYQLGEYDRAIAMWSKVIHHDPRSIVAEDAPHNIACAYRMLGVAEDTTDVSWYDAWINWLQAFPLFVLLMQCLALSLTFLFVGLFILHPERLVRVWEIVCVVFLIGLIIGVYGATSTQFGITAREGADMFVGPDTRHHAVAHIVAGKKVRVCGLRPGWYKVQSGKRVGWVQEQFILVI